MGFEVRLLREGSLRGFYVNKVLYKSPCGEKLLFSDEEIFQDLLWRKYDLNVTDAEQNP